MNNYSIVRVGDDYIVRAGNKNVLKVASRRRAARIVTDAAELLNAQVETSAGAEPAIANSSEVS